MSKFETAWNNVRTLDELAAQKTFIHQLHPGATLLTTFFFIVSVVSFGKYDLLALLPLVLYPVVLISLAELPARYLFKRLLIALPFVLFVGVFNPFFDRVPLLQIGGVAISGGWISFLSILLRAALTLLAALILIATSGWNQLAAALLKIKVPRIFVMQLLFLYRYLSVLMEETSAILRAHTLRSSPGKGLGFKVWGSLLGQLLLRTMSRAERIYQAMLCRGFTGEIRILRSRRLNHRDLLYCGCWSVFFLAVRLFNIPQLIGSFMTGVGK
jgi:cobalt/nickel transport system permease protein